MNNKILLPQLVSMLAASSGRSKKDSETFIKGFFSAITKGLEQNGQVKIKDFGTFKTVRVEPRKSVDVSTGEDVEIPAHYKITFTPAKSMAERINKEFSWLDTVEISDDVTNEELNSVEPEIIITAGHPDESEEEERSEHLGEEIEKDFGEIEPVEPFGPIDPDDPEPGEPIPEDSSAPTPPPASEPAEKETEPFVIAAVDIDRFATKKEIKGINKNIRRLRSRVDKNEKRNRNKFIAVFIWTLLLFAALSAGGFFLYYMWQQRGNSPEPQAASASCAAPGAENTDSAETGLQTEVAPETEESEESEVNVEETPETSESTLAEPAKPTEVKDTRRKDTVTTTRYLTTMAREYYGDMNFWPYIYIENSAILGNPDRITPGTVVVIPDLRKYGVNPYNPSDVEEAKMLGEEIYKNFK